MKILLSYALLLAAVTALPELKRDTDDDQCVMEWVTVYGDAPPSSSTSSGSTPSTPAISGPDTNNRVGGQSAGTDVSNTVQSQGQSSTASWSGTHTADASQSTSSGSSGSGTDFVQPTSNKTTTNDTTSALDLPNLPNGEPPIPLNDNYIHAPQNTSSPPSDAAIYNPKDAGVFDCGDFADWLDDLRKNHPPASQFIKIKSGSYRYKLGPVMPAGTDANTVKGENIVLYLLKGGWTVDLRGVTFYVDITPQNMQQRPSVMIYVLQSDGIKILGGTVWMDQGELFTQARVTSMAAKGDDGSQTATFEVEKGYNTSIWRTAGPRNQRCVDTSDPDKYYDPGCNFWKVQDYDFSHLDSDRTFTATVLPGGEAKVTQGRVITMQIGPNTPFTISNEDNSDLYVDGFVSNGGYMSIGVNPGQTAPHFNNTYEVNPPPRPGFAARVQGPGLSWGNLGGFVYNAPGALSNASFENSFYQDFGGPKNLQPGGDAFV